MAGPRATLLSCCLFFYASNATAQNVDFTGTWRGTTSGTKVCRNGLTVPESWISVMVELFEVGSSVSGAVSANAPRYDDECRLTGFAPIVIPISGTRAGSTLTIGVKPDNQTAGGQVFLSVAGSSMTFSLSIPDEGLTNGGSLSRTSSLPPSSILSGTFDGTFTNTLLLCNEPPPFTYTGEVSINLLQAGSTVTGCFAVIGGLRDHEEPPGSGHCMVTAEPTVSALVGQTDGAKMLVTLTNQDGGTLQLTASVSGSTIAGEITGESLHAGENLAFSATRTSSGFPRPCITSFTVARSTLIVGAWELSWSSINAASITIDNGIGIVPVGGSVTVSPKRTTVYTLTATGIGGSETATVFVSLHKRRAVRH